MQVNVKELTGVLHLNLVFMIVLVLQSFLAVFLNITSLFKCVALDSPSPKLTPRTPQMLQVFCKCDRCFEPLVQHNS